MGVSPPARFVAADNFLRYRSRERDGLGTDSWRVLVYMLT